MNLKKITAIMIGAVMAVSICHEPPGGAGAFEAL